MMEALLDKTGTVVHKAEEIDEEEEIVYEVGFVIKLGTEENPSEHYIAITLRTDDKRLYQKFETGNEYSLSFLEKHANKLQLVEGMEN